MAHVFKKKRKAIEDEASAASADGDSESPQGRDEPAPGGDGGPGEPDGGGPFDRSEGPWDVAELPADDQVIRVDFGSVRVPGVDGMSISLEVDEPSQQFVAVTVGVEEGAVQLQAFAAPRSGGFWDEVRSEIAKGISGSGGVVDADVGALGPQLRANVPVKTPEGENALQSVRFVGIEGPRWLLRGVMLGAAAGDPRLGEFFEDIVRGCVVVRGHQPMAPGDLLPLRLPPDVEEAVAEDSEDDGEEDGSRPPLNPFERGPEITEIR